jgi:hypothetical protein
LRPSGSTGVTDARPYGTWPGGYTVNARPCVQQRTTVSGKQGPVFRGRSW